MSIWQTIKNLRAAYSAIKAANPPFGGSQSGGEWFNFFRYPNSRIDFASEVGDLRNSTLVMAGTRWVATNLSSARLQVVEVDDDQKEIEIPHRLVDLIRRPNPYYSGRVLLKGIAYSWLTYATAYILIHRNRFGQPVELWYEPHYTIRPRWPQDNSEFISFYEVYRNGNWQRVEVEDVFVLRDGLDVATRCGMSSTSALLREYYTDQQAANFTALLLRNGLVPPVVVGLGTKDHPFTGDPEAFKAALLRKVSGDSAGEPMIAQGGVSVEKLGYDYSSTGLRDVRQIPEERFCAAMGVSAISLNLGTAKNVSTYSNVSNYLRHDYQNYIVPLHQYIADELTRQMLPEFGETDGLEVRWDYSQVPIMQRNKKEDAEIAEKLFKSDILRRSEARESIGYEWEESDEIYFSEIGSNSGEQFLTDIEKQTPPMGDDDDDAEDDREQVM